jgi:transcriptional regulator with XRE-family HTH domain
MRDRIDISPQMRELMRLHDLTLATMAAEIGVSKSAVEKYLAGPSSPRAVTVANICERFDESADWVLFGKVEDQRAQRALLHTLVLGALWRAMDECASSVPTPGTAESRDFVERELIPRAWKVVDEFFDERDGVAAGIPVAVPSEGDGKT